MCLHPSLCSHPGLLKMNNFRDVILLRQCFRDCQSANGDVKLLYFQRFVKCYRMNLGTKTKLQSKKVYQPSYWQIFPLANLSFVLIRAQVSQTDFTQ